MKCVAALGEVEQARSLQVRPSWRKPRLLPLSPELIHSYLVELLTLQFDLILIGGLTGRLDQTVHTLSYIHKLRTTRARVWVVSDDEVAWCLDTVRLYLSLASLHISSCKPFLR